MASSERCSCCWRWLVMMSKQPPSWLKCLYYSAHHHQQVVLSQEFICWVDDRFHSPVLTECCFNSLVLVECCFNSPALIDRYFNSPVLTDCCFTSPVLLLCFRCSNAETQIFTLLNKLEIGSASFNATTLANYYISGLGGSVDAIAQSATGVDFQAVENTINSTIQDTITVCVLVLSFACFIMYAVSDCSCWFVCDRA